MLHDVAPTVGVITVFLDGEDYGPGIDAMFLGSRYYARNMVPTRRMGVLIDMVGDRDLHIPREELLPAARGGGERPRLAGRSPVGPSEFADSPAIRSWTITSR